MPYSKDQKQQASASGKKSKRGPARPQLKKVWENLNEFINDEFFSHYIVILRRYKREGKDKEYAEAFMQLLKYAKPTLKSSEKKIKNDITILIKNSEDI